MKMQYFTIQPIKISKDIFMSFQSKKYTPEKNNWEKIENINNNFLETYNISINLFSILSSILAKKLYFCKLNFNIFSEEINLLNKNYNLGKNLIINKTNSGSLLLYDSSYNTFFIVYLNSIDLKLNTTADEIINIHHKIRNLLVIDSINGNKQISNWANKIRNNALSIIKNELNIVHTNNEILFPENSGYICSFFSEFGKLYKKTIKNEYKEKFLKINHDIDLIDEKKDFFNKLSIIKKQINPEDTILFLGWRFSTIFGIKNNNDLIILPILINLQILYTQINSFYKPILESIYEEVKYDNNYISLLENLKFFDKLTISFQNILYEKNLFSSNLKPYQSEIFIATEEYWGLKNEYFNIEKTIEICQKSLERKLSIKNNKIQQKQSNILFLLAIIQIFSIVSITGDYFNFYLISPLTKQGFLFNFLEKYLIDMLVILSFVLILFAYIDKLFYFIANLFKKIQNTK